MWTAMRSGCQKSLSSGCKWNLNTECVRVYDWLCMCLCDVLTDMFLHWLETVPHVVQRA
jgi:hypothetical protein